MPIRRSLLTREASSELGDGNFAITHSARTGRPIRKRRKTSSDESPFVDSALAISDPEEIGEDEKDNLKDNEVVRMPKLKIRRSKRKRSPSPPLSDDLTHLDELDSGVDEFTGDEGDEGIAVAVPTATDATAAAAATAPAEASTIVIKDLVINVPFGHKGPIVLEIGGGGGGNSAGTSAGRRVPTRDHHASPRSKSLHGSHGHHPKFLSRGGEVTSYNSTLVTGPKTKPAKPNNQKVNKNKKQKKTRAGFLDLPAELRNEIYRLVLVSRTDLHFDLPTNFSLTSALLRTNKQIHIEASGILYGNNNFIFRRRPTRYGSYWTSDWSEIGFKAVRRFLKSIGTTNTGLLRKVTLMLEDATPSLNSHLRTIESRRFVNDEVVLSVLRHLADHGRLEKLVLGFRGRRHVDRCDTRFLDHLFEISADKVVFEHNSNNNLGNHYPLYGSTAKVSSSLEKSCVEAMTREVKLYED